MSSRPDPQTFDFAAMRQQFQSASNDKQLFSAIVDAPFSHKVATNLLFLGIIELLLVDQVTETLNHKALSTTELAANAKAVSFISLTKIKIPLQQRRNVLAATVRDKQPYDTIDWAFLFMPALTPQQARINQASAGVAYSAIYPLKARAGGALIFSYFQYEQEIGSAQHDFMATYTKLVEKTLASS